MPQAITVTVSGLAIASAEPSELPTVSTGVGLYADPCAGWWMPDRHAAARAVRGHSGGGMTSVSPARITSGFVMLLTSMMTSTLTPNCLEML